MKRIAKSAPSTSKSFMLLSAMTAFEKVIGFIYQAAIAATIGANIITDCYFSTFELLSLIDYSIIAAMAVGLLKQYATIISEEGEEAGNCFLSNVRAFALPIALIVSIAIALFAYQITFVLAPTYSAAERSLLASNIRLMAFVPLLLTYVTFYLVILRRNKRFVIVSTKSLFINVVGIGSLFLTVYSGEKSALYLCLGYNIAIILYSMLAHLQAHNYGKLTFTKPKLDERIHRLIKMVLPIIVSNGIVRISLMIDRIISSSVGEGGVTCLTYSQMLFNFVDSMFIVNIGTILLSDFTNQIAEKEFDSVNNKLNHSLASMIILLVPVTIISVTHGFDISKIAFGRGQFTDADVRRVADLLSVYALGFVPSVVSNIYMQVLYSFGDSRSAMRVSIIAVLSNIAISLVSVYFFCLVGVAIGTAASYIVSGVLYYLSIKDKLDNYHSILATGFTARVIAAGLLCVCTTLFVHTLDNSRLVSFIVATLSGYGIFVTVLAFFKEPTIIRYWKLMKNRVFDSR